MALWQCGFFIIPQKDIQHLSFYTSLEEEENEEGEARFFDDAIYWERYPTKTNFFDEIGHLLPINKSWSSSIVLYGHQDSNRFEIYFEDELTVSVSFRIDFTSQYEYILRQIIEFCILKELYILDEKLRILPLNFLSIKEVIDNSPQGWKYKQLSKN